jgi:methylated-DNA-[protein]-cysteine S-methyltransferase
MITMTDAVRHTVLATQIGDLTVVRDGGLLTGLYFPHHWYRPDPAAFGPSEDEGFDLPLAPRGTPFQLGVWELIAQIPYGHTTTYGDLARRLDGDTDAQQVGAAVGRNPLSILIPCHRVIGSTGKLTGYAGGLKRKRMLLELEHARLAREDRVDAPRLW